MGLRQAALVILWLCLLGFCGNAAPAPSPDDSRESKSEVNARPQINLWQDISRTYPHAREISFAVVTIPDPRVPRYRRLYDLGIDALQLGMLSKSYVLDRWAMPWASGARKARGQPAELPNFGMMIFRCDVWRDANRSTGHSCDDQTLATAVSHETTVLPDARLRVVYLVPETATQGVEYDGLCQAVARIGEQLSGDPPASLADCLPASRHPEPAANTIPITNGYTGLMSFPNPACSPRRDNLVILGPVFSGSLDSIRTHRAELLDANSAIKNICLVSSAATVISNQLADDSGKPMASAEDSAAVPHQPPPTPTLHNRPNECAQGSAALPHQPAAVPTLHNQPNESAQGSAALPHQSAAAPTLHNQPNESAQGSATLPHQSAAAPTLHYQSLAVSDFQKFAKIAAVARALIRSGNVVLLSESSVFGFAAGNDVCSAVGNSTPSELRDQLTPSEFENLQQLCKGLHVIYFPPTIADIRYGIARQGQRDQSAIAVAAKNSWPSDHLDLDLGADDGTEFPDSHQSPLTVASMQLTLDQAMANVKFLDPSMVILVATDVRDRLFLFEQLRERLPTVTLVDLETDNLLTHPDFLHASRGAFAVASANLKTTSTGDSSLYGCEKPDPVSAANVSIARHQYWPTDVHGIFADAVSRLRDADQIVSVEPCIFSGAGGTTRADSDRQAILNVVGLTGFRSISAAYSAADEAGDAPASVRLIEVYGPIMCLLLPLVWLTRVLLPRVEQASPEPRALVRRQWRRWGVLLAAVLELVFLSLVMGATLEIGERIVGPSPLVACTVLSVIAMLGLWHCLRRLDDVHPAEPPSAGAANTGLGGSLPDFCVAAVPAVAAVGFAAAPFLRSHFDRDSARFANEIRLEILGTDLNSGLAFFGVIVLAVFVMHFTSIVFATSSHVVRRNLKLVDFLVDNRPPGAAGSLTFPAPDNAFSGSALLSRVPVSVVLILAAVILIEVWLGGMRLSVFGRYASYAGFLALCATTIVAGYSLAICFTTARRIRIFAGHIQAGVLADTPPHSMDAEIIGPWPGGPHVPLQFAVTPVLARLSDAGTIDGIVEHPSAWKHELDGKLSNDMPGQHRLALFLLLASEMSVFRWLVLATLVSSLASILMIYLYPIEADILVGFDLLILIAIGLLSGFMAATFEGNGVLSNILCNRPKKAAWSNSLFSFIAAPFAVLAIAILIVEMPGVIDWGGGILSLIASLGVHQ
jgi:hypothetical protein